MALTYNSGCDLLSAVDPGNAFLAGARPDLTGVQNLTQEYILHDAEPTLLCRSARSTWLRPCLHQVDNVPGKIVTVFLQEIGTVVLHLHPISDS